MEPRTWTATAASLLALALGVLGGTLPVPMVALGAGPTYDTLGMVDSAPVVTIDGETAKDFDALLRCTREAMQEACFVACASKFPSRPNQLMLRPLWYGSM